MVLGLGYWLFLILLKYRMRYCIFVNGGNEYYKKCCGNKVN